MSIGGRPKEEGGHEDLHITLCASIMAFLENVENKSKTIEEAIRNYYGKNKSKPKEQAMQDAYRKKPRRFRFIVGIPELGDDE